jgi:hypothetical protein
MAQNRTDIEAVLQAAGIFNGVILASINGRDKLA